MVVFGKEIISYKQSGYQGIVFVEGSESDVRRFYNDSFFETLEGAYKDLIIEIFYD